MEGPTLDMDALEARAKLQLKVHRTLLKHQLMMAGNALLVAFLFAALLMGLWIVMLSSGYLRTMLPWGSALFGLPPEELLRLNVIGFVALRFGVVLLLLCPGLGLRICGSAMKP
jgi:hypothetical protein